MHTIVTMGYVHLSLHSNILPKSRVKKRLIQLACDPASLLELSLKKERLMASSTRRYFRICVRDHEWVIVFRLTAPELTIFTNFPQKVTTSLIFENFFRAIPVCSVQCSHQNYCLNSFYRTLCRENDLDKFDLIHLKAKQKWSVVDLVQICKVSQRIFKICLYVTVFSKSFLFALQHYIKRKPGVN